MSVAALKKWAVALKSTVHALYLASRDPRVPLLAKLIIGVVVAYAISPIDLIPDFIPVIGYLDDLLLLPIGIWIATRLIPAEVWQECLTLAEKNASELPKSRRAALVIIVIWLFAVVAFAQWAIKYIYDPASQ